MAGLLNYLFTYLFLFILSIYLLCLDESLLFVDYVVLSAPRALYLFLGVIDIYMICCEVVILFLSSFIHCCVLRVSSRTSFTVGLHPRWPFSMICSDWQTNINSDVPNASVKFLERCWFVSFISVFSFRPSTCVWPICTVLIVT